MRIIKVNLLILIIIVAAYGVSGKVTRYEAEDLFEGDTCSSIIYYPGASDSMCRVAYVDGHITGYMQYGPYCTLAPGHYIATFGLMRGEGVHDSFTSFINPVLILDVTSGAPQIEKFYAFQKLYASSFDSVNEWQDFKVGFYLEDSSTTIQFRIRWFDSVDVYADYVDVGPNLDTADIVYAVNLQDLDLKLGFTHNPDSFDYEMTDRRILLGSIQGGLNRDKAQFVLLHNFDTYEAMGIYRWLYALDIPYTLITYDYCVDSLLMKKKDFFKGCVLFDPGTLEDTVYINDPPEYQKLLFQVKAIATNLAALDSLLIVTPRDTEDIDLDSFPIIYDLTNEDSFPFISDSTGESARVFNESLFDTCNFNKEIIFKLFPYRSWAKLVNAAEKLTDFTIQNRHWGFYKYIRKDTTVDYFEDSLFDTTHYIMGWSDEAWEWLPDSLKYKYYCGEYEHIYISSKAGKLWIGDMNRIHNLSFFSKVDYDTDYTYPQTVPTTPLLGNKVYISFLTMDGDNPVLWTKHYRKDWDDPQRGSIPVSWGIPPKLKDLAPSLLQHLYKTKTSKDCIISDISGLAWHYTNLFDFSDFPYMLDTAAAYLDSLNIKVVKLMGNRNKDLADVYYLQRFIKEYGDIGGFIEGYWPPDEQGFMMVKENIPSLRLAVNQPRPPDTTRSVKVFVDSVKAIIDSNPDKPLFLPVIYNISCSKYSKNNSLFDKLDSITTILDSLYGDTIIYSRLDVTMDLAKMQYKNTNIGNSIIKNGGFESGIIHWDTTGNVVIDTTKYHWGNKSLKLQGSSSAKQVVGVDDEQLYRIKVWLKPDSASTGTYRVIWCSPEATPDTTNVFSYTSKDQEKDWLFYFRDIKSPTNSCSAKVYCESDSGTVWFDDITVMVIDPLYSDDSLATAVNSQRKMVVNSEGELCYVYQSTGRVFFYSSTGSGKYDQVCFGDGEFPALASYTDTSSNEILGTVWLNDKVIYYSQYKDGWSEPCSLITYSGSDSMHNSPPSLAIDDSGTAHLSWGVIIKHSSNPDSVTYQLRYSTFNAGLDTPSIIDDDTLDEVKDAATGWADIQVLSSIDIYNDTIPVVVWVRPVGTGRDTVYFKQMSGDSWPDDPAIVSSSSDNCSNPFLRVVDNLIHIVWEEDSEKIKYRYKTLFGWSSIESVSNVLKESRNPQIVYCDSLMCVYTEEPQLQPNHCSYIVYRVRKGFNNWSSSRTIESSTVLSEYPQSYTVKQGSERDLHTIWIKGNAVPYKAKYKETNLP